MSSDLSTKIGDVEIDLTPAVSAFRKLGVSMEQAAEGLRLFGKKLGGL